MKTGIYNALSLLSGTAVLVAVMFMALGTGCAESRRQSAILISIDSLRADHLGCYGYERDTSPAIDRLAGEGMTFLTAVADSSWTLPTHHTMLTGLPSGVHGVLADDRALSDDHVTLPELLRDAGWRTHGIWSGPYLHPIFGFGQGFDEGDWVGVVDPSRLDRPDFEPGKGDRTQVAIARASTRAERAVSSPEVLAQALAFLDEVGDEPFFLFVHFFDVHYDYVPPEEYWRRFDPDYAGSYTGADFIDDKNVHEGMDPRELEHILARYDGEIAYVDDHVERLVEGLGDRARDTLVVVTSDHGEEFFEHGRKSHGFTLYDEVLLVPLVFWQPGSVEAGARVPEQVHQMDLAPTILEWLGLGAPDRMMGKSLAPILEGSSSGAKSRPVVSRLRDPSSRGSWTALRRPKEKYVSRTLRSGETEELYFDLQRDPGEEASGAYPPASGARDALRALEELERARHDAIGARREETELSPELEATLRDLGYAED